MRVDKLKVVSYVTPIEAAKINAEYRPTCDMEIAKDIYDEAWKHCKSTSETWNFLQVLAAIWNGGRMQGIREERHKKRKGAEG